MKTETQIQPISEANSYQEKILSLRSTSPDTWSNFDPSTRMAALMYEAGRREFFRLEAMKNETDNDLKTA